MSNTIKDDAKTAVEEVKDVAKDLASDVAAVPADLEGATKLRATETNTDDKAIRRTRTIATVILAILILIILAACAMMYALLGNRGLGLGDRQTAGITWIRSIYGHGTTADGLINPSSVIFSADGNSLWVTDSARHRLVQYDLNGRLVSIVNADWRVNEMIFPSRIAISPKGWYYVAEQTYNRVQIFDENFNHIETVHIEKPTAVAANDDLMLVGSRRGFAQFTYDGQPVGMHAADSEDEINHFDYVHALALDDNNNSFVLDSFGNRFVKYDDAGVPQYEVLLGHPGNQGIDGGRNVDQAELEADFPANLQLPQGLTLDGNGRLYIIDMFDFSVAIFNVDDGSFIRKVGAQGTGDGSFHNPNCIDYNPHMDMFASAEASLGRVQLFSIEGSSGDPLTQIRRNFSDFLDACCIPLIIILIITAAYLISRYLTKKRREKELTAALADPSDSASEGVVEATRDKSAEKQKT
ncbi:MAG: NHL repeat-containing protein [Coriobacteriia bacterium]|nr:NHL repeat-containing protein [Coriobacteriia bacterium]MCL2537260.1 NHL repeat-containing protein [Coriobacteriia bacterium]